MILKNLLANEPLIQGVRLNRQRSRAQTYTTRVRQSDAFLSMDECIRQVDSSRVESSRLSSAVFFLVLASLEAGAVSPF